MSEFGGLGKLIFMLGVGMAAVGLVMALVDKVSGMGAWLGWFGRLPGDFVIRRGHVTVYIPLTTGILVSVAVSVILSILMKR